MQLWILLFADDVVIVTTTPQSMHRVFEQFDIFCGENALSINASKTEMLIYRYKSCTAPKEDFFVSGEYKFKIVDSFKYLGVHFTNTACPKYMI